MNSNNNTAQAQLVPIQELTSDTVHINLHVPEFLEKDRIGIDIIRLETLCRIAGIRELRIETMKTKEKDTARTIITGRNEDGTATGTFVVNQVNVSKSTQQNCDPNTMKLFSQINAKISIDMEELARKISTKYPNGIRSIEGWCKELEKIIIKHIQKEGLWHLLSGRKRNGMMDASIALQTMIIGSTLGTLGMGNAEWVKIYFLMLGIIGRDIAELRITQAVGEGRISPLAIGGIEWDRALFFAGMILATRNAVGVITK